MRTHTGVKPYVCNVCSRAFTKSTYLQLHLRTHSGEKPYICQYCNRAFARANTLARHITMHTGEAKYQCTTCKKSFRRLTSLNEHVYTHTGQRPYACKICSKRYNNAGSLYAHTKKCKTLLANEEASVVETPTNYPVSLQHVETMALPQVDSGNNVPQEIVIVTDAMTLEPQFLIPHGLGEKPLVNANMLDPFGTQEPDMYAMNGRQLKIPYYGLYQSM